MSTKTIGQLDNSSFLDGNDFIAVYNAEPVADAITYKARISELLSLRTISVNGKTGSTITLNADDISDTVTSKKFVTEPEKDKINLIRSDLGGNVYLAGDGTYKTIGIYTGATTILIVSGNTSINASGNYLVICNTTNDAIDIDLPANPTNMQIIRFKDSGNAYTHNVTVNGNGRNIEDDSIAGINSPHGAFELIYIEVLNKWLVISFLI